MQQVLRQIQEAVEPVLERSLTKRRRQEFLASAGPLFLCLTFIEDALRVLLRWKEQMSYMTVTMRMRAPPLPSEPQRISLGPRASHAPLAAAAQERLAGWTPAHLFARDAGAGTAAPGRAAKERERRETRARAAGGAGRRRRWRAFSLLSRESRTPDTRRQSRGSAAAALTLDLVPALAARTKTQPLYRRRRRRPQMTGSVLVLRPKEVKPSRVKVGCYTLLAFVFLQPFMYGQARSAEISRDQPRSALHVRPGARRIKRNTDSCIPTSAREDTHSAVLTRCSEHTAQSRLPALRRAQLLGGVLSF